MKPLNEITAELTSLDSLLATLPRIMPYSVPGRYFDALSANILAAVNMYDKSEQNINFTDNLPYTVPENYFDTLGQRIAEKIEQQAMPKENLYNTPEGYFDTLPLKMLDAAKAADGTTRIISLGRKNIWKQIRWAAAAILLLGIGAGSYKTIINQPFYKTERTLASVPDTAITNYMQQNSDDFDTDMLASSLDINNIAIQPKQLDKKEIVQYLNETGWSEVE